jgi:cell division protease FtsH
MYLWFVGLFILNYFIGKYFVDRMSDLEKIPYTVFKQEVLNHNVKEIYSKGSSLSGNFINQITVPTVEVRGPKTDTTDVKVIHFTTELPSFIDPGLEALLIENGVTIRAEPIGDDQSIELPLAFKNVLQQVSILTGISPVDFVVG